MAYMLPVGKRIPVQIAYVDADGNPAKVDGAVAWSSSDAAVGSVLVDTTDSTRAWVDSLAVGDYQINATADADLGSGVRELVTFFAVTAVGAEAVAGTISPVGEPIDTPVVTPH